MTMSARIPVPLLLVAGIATAATRSDLRIGNRTAIVYNPTVYKNPPLVISMHGRGIPASWNQGMMMFEKYADTAQDKFITVYPQGEDNVWDLGGTKDVNFILAIIDSMVRRYGVDRNRVYASGFSMGGMMSWMLSCKIPDKIAAIVPGNGFPLGGMSGCSEVRHVPVLHIHGTADDFVKYTDFVNSFNPSQRTRYGCPTAPVRTSPYPADKPGSLSFKETWAPCVKNGLKSEISLIHVTGMIHDWATPGKANANEDPKYKGKPFDIDGTQEAWNWMKLQSLNGSTGVSDRSAASSRFSLTARFRAGRIELRGDQPILDAKLLDLQGRTVATWSAQGGAGRELTLAAGGVRRGVYLVEAASAQGRTVANLLVP